MLQFIKSTIAFIGAIFFSAVNKLFCSPCVQKYVAYFWLGFFTVSDAMASSKGAGGFTKATTEIQSYETPVANLMKAIAAVIVLVGAFNVYFKMQKDRDDDHWRMCGFHRHVRGPSNVLQVKGTPMSFWGRCPVC